MESAMKRACPDEEVLADYLEGHLPDEERFQMEQHLSDCHVCLEALVVTNSLIRDKGRYELDPVPAEVTKAAVDLVTRQGIISSDSLIEKLKRSVKNICSRI
jgi:anti-sigma factor RsiW